MKTKIILCLSASVLLFTNASKKHKEEIPPGTVAVNDTLFIDKAEINNFSWMEYVDYNKRKYGIHSQEYLASLPDTLVWEDKNSYNKPYVEYYHKHPAYKHYPVVGISYEQAVAFCKWRTEQVNYFINIRDGKQIYHPDSSFRGKIKYEYRLPTKQEWEAIALLGNDYKKCKSKSVVTENLLREPTINSEEQINNSDITAPVHSYWPNKLGVYNLKGNVSEMISEKGIAKGGSWRDIEKSVFLLNDFKYDKPSATIGFRCVCVKR